MKNIELAFVNKIRKTALGLLKRAAQPARGRLRLGIGDDAAILGPPGRSQELLITTDLLVEGSHFDRSRHPIGALGHKTLARGLSDIAAMGGEPLYFLLSLCLPRWFDEKCKKQFFAGLFQLAASNGVMLIGGDVSAGQRFVADVVVLGADRRGRELERGRAEVGDTSYVSGRLGGSALGLAWLKGGFGPKDPAVRRHLYPTPRLELGRYLAGRLKVRAALDVSDGLSIDLYRLVMESRVGAEIRLADIPVFPGATVEQALHGGEDYELLFTLKPGRKAPAAFQGIPLTAIGIVTAAPTGRRKARGHPRLTLVGAGGRKTAMPIRGFEHSI